MENFNSGDHTFILKKCEPVQKAKGEQYLKLALDVPFTEQLHDELGKFLFKDVKMLIQEASGKNTVESEFYIENVLPKNLKDGPRLVIPFSQPLDRQIFLKLAKLWNNDVKFEMEVIQEELEFDAPEVVNE